MIANARDYTGDPTHAAACATLGREVVHMTVREWRCWPLAMHERRDSLIANLRNLRKWRIPPC